MLHRHPAAAALQDILNPKPVATPSAVVLDNTDTDDEAKKKAAAEEEAKKKAAEEGGEGKDKPDDNAGGDEGKDKGGEGDGKDKKDDEEVLDNAGSYQDSDIALKAVAAVQEWAETPASDRDEGEGSADRLFSLLAGIADADMDGEVSETEADVINLAANAAADYLIAKGVPEADAVALLEGFDNDLGETVQELVLSGLPDGEDADIEIDGFVFGDGSDDDAFDATYRKKVVIRRGRKVRINKRVSGRVRLSAKQKVAVRKMLRKSHSAGAQLRRAKSVKVRRRMGI